MQRKAYLDSYQEELVAREEKLGETLKEARDAAATAEAAKKELEMRVTQLEANLKTSSEELVVLKREREKDAAAHGELQGLLAERSKELSTAKDSNADLELKLATLTQTLDGAKEREVTLSVKGKADEALLASIAVTQNSFKETVEHWTEGSWRSWGWRTSGTPPTSTSNPAASSACSSKVWRRPSSGSGRGSQSSWPTSRAGSA